MVFRTAAAANPLSQTAVYVDGHVLYGCANKIAVWEVGNGSNHVECVFEADGDITAIAAGEGCIYFGTTKGQVGHFELALLTKSFSERIYNTVASLESAVTCIAVNKTLSPYKLAVGCINGSSYVFSEDKSQDTIVVSNKGYALAVELYDNLLVCGGTNIKLYVHNLDTGNSIELEGHENWVRSLAFKKDSTGSLILASASQEKYIRLWRFDRDVADNDFFSSKKTLDNYEIRFEALLMGHDDWVVCVQWDTWSDMLLSASADSSVIIWESGDDGSDLWTPLSRYGDISIWGSSTATGTSGGFWTCLWLPNQLLTVTHTGSFRMWTREGEGIPAITGHFKEVTDCQWLSQDLLLTTSSDQTTRLWKSNETRVYEVGRPQIHGYDMVCVTVINDILYASAGDEKVVRVFEMPKQVAHQLHSGLDSGELMRALNIKQGEESEVELPDVAGVPALGLSNKPDEEVKVDLPPYPREDQLQRLTLWPEVEKLYGHGYEISALAYADGILASCCKANNEQHAVIRFYNTETWHEIRPPVAGHAQTVNKLSVSPNKKLLLSVSRDRKFMLTDLQTRTVILSKEKAHTRIIWDGCFISDHEFVTVSRDKTVKKWNTRGESFAMIKLESSGTAVAACDSLIAVGEENGIVTFMDFDLNPLYRYNFMSKVNRISFKGDTCAIVGSHIVLCNPKTDAHLMEKCVSNIENN